MHKLKYGGAGLRFMRYPAEMEIIVPDLGTHVCYACIFIHVNPGWRGHEFMKEAWDAVLRETQEPELDAFQALTGKACPAIIYRDTLLAFTNDCFFFRIIKTVVTERI